MIHVEATIKYAGYDPRELNKWSKKRVCLVCDVCGRVRWARFDNCGDLCPDCSRKSQDRNDKVSMSLKGRSVPQEVRDKISKTLTGTHHTEEAKRKISEAQIGITRFRHTKESKQKLSIAHTGKVLTNEHKQRISDAFVNMHPDKKTEWKQNISAASKGRKGKPHTEETKQKLSKINKGKVLTPEHVNKILDTKRNMSPERKMEWRRRTSAANQGIPYEEWTGFSNRGNYCENFDEACRERIREKYNRLCYICNDNEENNGQKLSVHHVDQNKNQGCDGVLWKLVPLCRKCHSIALGEPLRSRIGFLLSVE